MHHLSFIFENLGVQPFNKSHLRETYDISNTLIWGICASSASFDINNLFVIEIFKMMRIRIVKSHQIKIFKT